MRNIDFYVGVPLCFVMSAVDKLLSIFRSKTLPKPQKVLFIELSEMGSAILADPCLRQTQDAGCELFFLIFKKNRASLRLLGTVPDSHVFVLRESSLFLLLWDTLRFAIWCRRKKIDSCVDLELFSRVTSLLTWATFAGNKVGFHRYHQEGLYRGEFFTHRVPYNPQIHIAHNFMNLVESLIGIFPATAFLKRELSPADLKVAQVKILPERLAAVKGKLRENVPYWSDGKEIILVNANAGEFLPQRKWPREYFVELIQKILDHSPNNFVLLTGAPMERDDNNWITNKVSNPKCVNFSGCVDFEELPALYTLSKVLITNDSGPGHFSSVTGIRSFVFFGPETPALYGSLGNSTPLYAKLSCSPCVSATNHRKTSCTDNVCLKVITPEIAFREIQASL